MPVYGKIDVPFVQCVMGMLSASTVVQMWDFLPGDSLINRARNNLAKRFLDGFPGQDGAGNKVTVKHDWMLFLDTDLVFKPESVELIYALGQKRGPGIYCGAYPMKQLKPKVVFNNMTNCVPDSEGVVEVREAGTGFMLIHREVFERMQKECPEIEFEVDVGEVTKERVLGWDFFTVGVYFDPLLKRKRFLSEDWYFCQRWRGLGGKVFMHTKISCNHLGVYSYPGNPQEIMDAADHYRKAGEMMAKAAAADKKPIVVQVGPPETFKPAEEPVAVPA